MSFNAWIHWMGWFSIFLIFLNLCLCVCVCACVCTHTCLYMQISCIVHLVRVIVMNLERDGGRGSERVRDRERFLERERKELCVDIE